MNDFGPTSERGEQHPELSEIRDFLLGKLGVEDSARIERHLEHCDDCGDAGAGLGADGDFLVEALRCGFGVDSGEQRLRTQLGYQIMEELGAGGMAVVYKARHQGLDRIVAWKRIRAGIDANPEERLRFRREAEAAAALAHPNIVQVFDAGEQDGQPYLTMEFLEGGTLAEHLENGPLRFDDAAALTEQLARAVEYAHDRGVIHRDIKPANILFAERPLAGDGRALHSCAAKLADFGLARRGDDPVLTRTGTFAGTPCYMAPEQTSDALLASPASDVYALGSVLYHCLTGRPPFQAATVLDTLEQVRSQDPLPPSNLPTGCPRDLETVCLKCLAKRPERRYPSAAALADDLRRYLERRPILARRVSILERGTKWAQRRPAVAALIVVTVAAMLAFVASGWVVSVQMRTALEARVTAQRQAERNLKHARDAWNANLWKVSVGALADVPASGALRRELLELAVEQYESLFRGREPPANDTRHAFHLLLVSLADVYSELRMREQADATYRRAILQSDKLAAQDPENHGYAVQSAATRVHYGIHLNRLGRYSEALPPLRGAVETLKKLVDVADPQPGDASQLAQASDFLVQALSGLGRHSEIEPHSKRAIEMADLAVGGDPDVLARRIAASVYHNHGLRTVDPAERLRWLRKGTQLLQSLVDEDTATRTDRFSLANALLALGHAHGADELAKAEQVVAAARALFQELAVQFPRQPRGYRGVARCDYMLADVYRMLGRAEQAKAKLAQALAIREKVHLMAPENAEDELALAETLSHLGLVRSGLGELDQAERDLRRAADIQGRLTTRHPTVRRFALSDASNLINLGEFLRVTGRHDEALQVVNRAVEHLERLLRDAPDDAVARTQSLPAYGVRALALQATGRTRASIADWNRVVELAPDSQQTGYRISRALARVDAGEYEQAAVEARASADTADALQRYNLACVLARCATGINERPPTPDRDRLIEDYTSWALELIASLQATDEWQTGGLRAHAEKDPDLEILRQDARYQAASDPT